MGALRPVIRVRINYNLSGTCDICTYPLIVVESVYWIRVFIVRDLF